MLIEAGFMGTALLQGLLKQQTNTSQASVQLAACVQSAQSLDRIKATLGTRATEVTLGHSNEFAVEITKEAKIVILGVRPGDLGKLLETSGLVQALDGRIVVSMLAGVSLQKLAVATKNSDVVRVIPTIGAQNGDSVSLLSYAPSANPARVAIVREMFDLAGSVTDVPESLLNHTVGFSAACHALSLVAVDTITDAGVAEGLPRSLAAALARRSLGSAIGVLEGGMSVEQMKEAVSTPSGITLNSVVQYERDGVRGGIAGNVQQAVKYACSM